jgi:hypothetical protein
MKILLPLILALMGGSTVYAQAIHTRVATLPNSKKYVVTYDRFTDTTRVSVKFNARRTKSSRANNSMIIAKAYLEFKGTEWAPVDQYYLEFYAACAGACYEENHKLIFLIGEERISMPEGTYIKDPRGNYPKSLTYETMTFAAGLETIKKIINGPQTEFRLGNYDGIFDADDRADIANIVKLGEK